MSKHQLPDIYTYSDFRVYLGDCYTACKEQDSGFTYRSFSARAGLTSPSILKEVIDGKIGLTKTSLPKYIRGFGMNKKQGDYFRILVTFNQAKTEAEKNGAYIQLLAIRRQVQAKTLDDTQYEYCDNWYTSVIRELISTDGFQNDAEWIARTILPGITPAQARRALQVLMSLKMITRDPETGRLHPADSHIDLDPEINRLAVRNLNRAMIERAKDAIELIDPEKREISHSTLSVSKKTYDHIQQLIRKFKADVLEYIAHDENPSEMVCQMNVQLFPFTREKSEDEK